MGNEEEFVKENHGSIEERPMALFHRQDGTWEICNVPGLLGGRGPYRTKDEAMSEMRRIALILKALDYDVGEA